MIDTSTSQNNWRTRVFESLSFPTLVLTPDRTIVAANKHMLEKIGAPKQDIVGKTCREIFEQYFFEEGLPCMQATCPLDQALQDKLGHTIQRQVERCDGKICWEDRVFSPILDETGGVLYIIESIRDITWTKKLEHMVTGMREFVNRMVQSSASAIVAADRAGRILLMNAAAEELFGYSLEDIGRIRASDLYPPGTASDLMKKLRNDHYGGKGKLPPTKIHILTSGGKRVPVEMTGGIIYESGREMATMGIYNDLTERIQMEQKLREAEAQLIQSEKLASLGRLAAGVAHEINNPLTGIVLYGNIILEKLGADNPLRQSMEYILEDAGRCKDIVQNLLTYSRQKKSSLELFTVNSMVEESLRLIRDQKLFINVTLNWELTRQPLQVMADHNRLRQVVINLVINAIDAMENKGMLTLRTYKNAEDQTACLEIEDSGCGIAEGNLLHIFDPFFTTKQPGRGTGLGLSTAYGIVHDNKGEIRVKKTGPQGTTFLVKLPLVDYGRLGMPESVG